jgi:hypothetical protein
MKKSVKAALLSGLLLPGAGQIWLKHWARGVILIAATLASLAAVVVKVGQQAFAILERIEAEGGAIDLVAIMNTAHISSVSDSSVKYASLAVLAIWIVGIVDAYLLGDKEDRGL